MKTTILRTQLFLHILLKTSIHSILKQIIISKIIQSALFNFSFSFHNFTQM